MTYFAISFYFSWIRFTGFRAQTWDIGIFQQSLWSFNHGRGFFDAADFERSGVISFFGIHPAFLMYPLGYFYGVVPSVYGLFALQSAAVALAAVPLYFLASRLSASPWKGLLCSGMFLIWAPTLSGNLFDFHLEAFLPLEMFTFVALWARGRFLLAVIPAAFACITLEVGPLLVAAAGIFFLLEGRYQAKRVGEAGSPRPEKHGRSLLRRVGVLLRKPPVLFGISCLVGGVAVYLALRHLESTLYGGAAPLAAGSSAFPSLIDPFRYGVGGLFVDFGFLSDNLFQAVTYWMLLYALLAFIPLRALRTLVLTLPWFGFTLIAQHTNYTLLGNSYEFIVAVGAFVGFAYGISSVRFSPIRNALRAWWDVGPGSDFRRPILTDGAPGAAPTGPEVAADAASDPGTSPQAPEAPSGGVSGGVPGAAIKANSKPASWNLPGRASNGPSMLDAVEPHTGPAETPGPTNWRVPPRRTGGRPASPWTVAILAVLVLNVVLSPLDPLMSETPLGAGYKVNYSTPAEFRPIEQVAALIPSNAALLASSDLFPYIANNVNAYTTQQTQYQPPPVQFPFNSTNPPRFVFVSQAWYDVLPPWLDAALWNTSHYGVRAVIGQSSHGWIYLFEHGYRGPVLNFLIPPLAGTPFYNAVDGMRPGPAGILRPDNRSEGNTSILDPSGTPGVVWMGPDVLVPAGNYSFFAFLRVWLLNSSVVPSTSVPLVKLWLSTLGRPSVCPTIVNLGTYVDNSTKRFSAYNSTNYQSENWTLVQISRCVSNAGGFAYLTPDVQFVGLLASQDVGVELNFVWMQAMPTR